MISKANIKKIRSLQYKKYRQAEGLFVAEGPRTVAELTRITAPVALYEGEDAVRASSLQHPQGVLALFPTAIFDHIHPTSTLSLMLDGIQDPGNLGTILRIADWFGIDRVVCSLDTADFLNPKTIQASMGAIAHVKVEYSPLAEVLEALPKDFPVYGTTLDGENIFQEKLTPHGIIVVGNEGNGIRAEVLPYLTKRLLIPPFSLYPHVESLNVGAATAIVCAQFRRL